MVIGDVLFHKSSRLAQQFVAGIVSAVVVYDLEPVEVHIQKRIEGVSNYVFVSHTMAEVGDSYDEQREDDRCWARH